MKKTILAVALLAVVAVTTVIAQESARNFQYDLNREGNGVVIKKYIGSNPNLVIPGRIEGYPVVEIGYVNHIGTGTFSEGTRVAPSNLLVSLVIPENVRIVNMEAFRNQKNLTSVTLPSTLRVIGGSAFRESGLRTVRIPDSVEEIGGVAFGWNGNLTDVNIPAGIKRIGVSAFHGCSTLSSVTIPASIRSIEWIKSSMLRDDEFLGNAFKNCALSIATRRRLVELGYNNSEF